MRATAAVASLVLSVLSSGCGLVGEVDNEGQYTFLPGAAVSDSSAYPLQRLLIIDEDEATEKTLIYLFSGDLPSADLGFQDLRRIARDHHRPNALFAYAKLFLAQWTPTDSDGSGVAAATGGEPVSLSLDGREAGTLWPLDDEELLATGASRYLRSVTDPRFPVRAYFGVLDGADEHSELSVRGRGFRLSHTLLLRPATLSVANDDGGELLLLLYVGGERADYVLVDLLQTITRLADQAPVETMVRTSLPPAEQYGAPYPLVNDMFSIGCWSKQRQLVARLTQVSRYYTVAAEGDWAVIHNRASTVEVGADLWTPAVISPSAAAYCSDYE